jgi:methyl-accepting chemotaxis protein
MTGQSRRASRYDQTAQKYAAGVALGLAGLCVASIGAAAGEMRWQTVTMAGVGAGVMGLWGVWLALQTRRGRVMPRLRHLSLFLPLFFLTLLKFSFLYGKLGYGGVLKDQLSFDAYFLIVVLSGFYNDRRLTLMAGVGAALCNVLLIGVGMAFFGVVPTRAVEAAVDVGRVRLVIELLRCSLFVAVAVAMNVFSVRLNGLVEEVRRSESATRGVLETVARLQPQLQAVLAPIRESAKKVAETANLQALGGQVIGSSTAQLAATVHQTATNATGTRHIAEQNRADAVAGNERLGSVRSGFAESLGRVEAVDGRLAALTEAIERTEAINQAIRDISEGLRYLAVNASLEAAKAGESGRGFAVVAREIQRLVQESGTDLARSRAVLGDLRLQVSQLSGEATQATARLRHSVGELDEAGTLVEKVVASFGHTVAQFDSIATAANEQAVGLEEIANAISDLDRSATALDGASSTLQQGIEQIARTHAELDQMLAAAGDGTHTA